MRDSAQLAEQHDVRLHTHLAETIDEEAFCREMFGLRTVDYLDSVGWLSTRTWLGHGIHFDDNEIARLGAAGTAVAHCPSSNMRLASGIARAVELEDAGAPVGIGVDGSASNDASNMILEARQALYLQRLKYGAELVTPQRALGWATRGFGSSSGSRRPRVSWLPAGRPTWRCSGSTGCASPASHDPLSALLLCGADHADRVLVGGRWRVVGLQLVDVDVPRLIVRHSEAARRLLGSAT